MNGDAENQKAGGELNLHKTLPVPYPAKKKKLS